MEPGLPCGKCHKFFNWQDIRTSLLNPTPATTRCKNCWEPPFNPQYGRCTLCHKALTNVWRQLQQTQVMSVRVCCECYGNMLEYMEQPDNNNNNNFVLTIDTTKWSNHDRERMLRLQREIENDMKYRPDPRALKRQDTVVLPHAPFNALSLNSNSTSQ